MTGLASAFTILVLAGGGVGSVAQAFGATAALWLSAMFRCRPSDVTASRLPCGLALMLKPGCLGWPMVSSVTNEASRPRAW